MKTTIVIFLLVVSLVPAGRVIGAVGPEFVCLLYDHDVELPIGRTGEFFRQEYGSTINLCDTGAGRVTGLIRTGLAYHGAVVPDGKIYFTSWTYEYLNHGIDGWGWTPVAGYVKRLYPTRPPGEDRIEYGGEEAVYEIPLTPEGTIPRWDDFEVRTIAPGVDRVYFSVSWGSSADGTIYYIDESGHTQLYYTVRLDEIQIPSCSGLTTGHWNGHFFFDQDENLYLSSGGHIPASIFRVERAGPNSVDADSSPVPLHEHHRGVRNFVLQLPDQVFFARRGGESTFDGARIFRLTLGDPFSEELVFEDTVYEDLRDFDLLKMPSEIRAELPLQGAKARRISPWPELRTKARGRIHKVHKGPPDLSLVGVEYGVPKFKDEGKIATLPVRMVLRNEGAALLDEFKINVTVTYAKGSKPSRAPFVIAGPKPKPSFRKGSHPGAQVARPKAQPSWQKGLKPGEEVAVCGHVRLKHPQGASLYGKQVFSTILAETPAEERDQRNNQVKRNFRLSHKTQ